MITQKFDNTPQPFTTVVTRPDAPAGGFFFGGLGLALRNWRCFTWTAFFSLLLAALTSLPVLMQYSDYLSSNGTGAALAGPMHLATFAEMELKMSQHTSGSSSSSAALDFLFVLFVFVTTPGVLAIYLSGEPASLGNMFRTGLRYFWRFVRLYLVWGIITAIVVGLLSFLRKGVLVPMDHAAATKGEFYVAVATAVIIVAVLDLFRLWADLAEVITVDRGLFYLGGQEDRRSVRTLGAAFRLLKLGIVRLYLAFLTIGALGWAGLLFFLLLWHGLTPYGNFRAFLLGQLGLLCLLAARFWQHGMETAWYLRHAPVITPIAVPAVAPAPYVEPVYAEPVVVRPDPVPTPEPTVEPGSEIPHPPYRPPAADPDELPGSGPEPLPA